MNQGQTVKISVSPEVARIVAKDAPRDLRLAAAKGTLGQSGRDLVTTLYFLCHGADLEIRAHAVQTLRQQPAATLVTYVVDPAIPPQFLHFVAQIRLNDPEVIKPILDHPVADAATRTLVAEKCSGATLHMMFEAVAGGRVSAALVAALQANPHLTPAERSQLDGMLNPPVTGAFDAASEDAVEPTPDEDEPVADAEEEVNGSKYQMALEMGVSEKIKMALTGDKEWRAIFLKDPNKLVHGAAIKNPRITDGEVLAIAKNKASSEELIRAILLNKEWIKNPVIRGALVFHPKTPVPQALKYMTVLGIKELKILSKSKGVSQVLVNAARRLVADKDKK